MDIITVHNYLLELISLKVIPCCELTLIGEIINISVSGENDIFIFITINDDEIIHAIYLCPLGYINESNLIDICNTVLEKGNINLTTDQIIFTTDEENYLLLINLPSNYYLSNMNPIGSQYSTIFNYAQKVLELCNKHR
jgi:hypothetical protein